MWSPFESILFDKFEAHAFPLDLQGWNVDTALFERLIEGLRPQTVIEVGTWKGASALKMASIIAEMAIDARIVCIDTWLGSPEHYLDEADAYDWLQLRHGFPQLYQQFLANVVHTGHQKRIFPLPQTTAHAAAMLARTGIKAELIYLDAAHDEPSVSHDLDLYWPLLTESGIMFGDDYSTKWPGVKRAVEGFAARWNVALFSMDEKWLLVPVQSLSKHDWLKQMPLEKIR